MLHAHGRVGLSLPLRQVVLVLLQSNCRVTFFLALYNGWKSASRVSGLSLGGFSSGFINKPSRFLSLSILVSSKVSLLSAKTLILFQGVAGNACSRSDLQLAAALMI